MCCRGCGIGLGAIAITMSVISLLCSIYLPMFVNDMVCQQIKKKKVLGLDENGKFNEVMQKFLKPPYPMKIEFWPYNVTNAVDLMQGKTDVAILKEHGPFAFDMKIRNEVKLNENATRLFYRTFTTYFFNESATCPSCSLDDVIIVPSVAFQGIIYNTRGKTIQQLGVSLIRIWDRLINSYEWPQLHTAYRIQKVRELLFEGYVDDVVERLCNLATCPPRPDRIGFYYQRNGTNAEGEYEIDTGKENVMNIGRVYSWNGNNGKLNDSYWFGEEARMIKGTDSKIFPPFDLLNRKSFNIFAGQVCRSLEMEFQGFSIVGGLPMQRYSLSKEMQNDWKKGFCGADKNQDFFEQKQNCPPSGLMEIDGCDARVIRVYVSNGHYYGADNRLRDKLTGFPAPNRDDDTTFLDIEPHVGVITQAKGLSLISIGVRGSDFPGLGDMKERITPLMMLNISTHYDAETRELIGGALKVIQITSLLAGVCNTIAIAFAVVALMLISCDCVKICMYKYRKVAPKKESIFLRAHKNCRTVTITTTSPENRSDDEAVVPLCR